MPRRRKSVAPQDEFQVLRDEIQDLRMQMNRMKQSGPSTMQTDDWEKTLDPVQGQFAISHPGRQGRANAVSGVTVYHNGQMRNINSGANFVIKVFADDESVEAGDGAFIWHVPEDVDTLQLCYAEAGITTLGAVVRVDLQNLTQSLDMLSTSIEIDAGQYHSHASLPLPVINMGNSQVAFMDRISIDVDAAGGKGLTVTLVFL